MTGSARLNDDEWLVGIGAQVRSDTDPDGEDPDEYDEGATGLDDDPGADDADDDVVDAAVDPDEQFHGDPTDDDLNVETDPDDEVPATDHSKDKRRRFTPWVLGAGVAAVAVATVITTVVSGMNSPNPPAKPASSSASRRPSAPRPPSPPPPPVDPNSDGPLPFTATSDCDEAGSTPAQSVAVPDTPTPWICVIHGPGQLLDIVLGPPGMPQSYVITGVAVVPGAIGMPGRPANEPDPWLSHQVPTRLQFSFDDPAHTVLPLDTHNVRGEVPLAVPRITASRIRVIIQQTSPPPPPIPTPTAEAGPGVFGSVLGPPAPPQSSYPADSGTGTPDTTLRTFAMSRLKIIGHKAI